MLLSACQKGPFLEKRNNLYQMGKIKSAPQEFFNLGNRYDYIFYKLQVSYDALVAAAIFVKNLQMAPKSYIFSYRDVFNPEYLEGATIFSDAAQLGEKIEEILKTEPLAKFLFITNSVFINFAWESGYSHGLSPTNADFYFLADGVGLGIKHTFNNTPNMIVYNEQKAYFKNQNRAFAKGEKFNFETYMPISVVGTEPNHYNLHSKTMGETYNPEVLAAHSAQSGVYEKTIYDIIDDDLSSSEKEHFSNLILPNKGEIDQIFKDKKDNSVAFFIATSTDLADIKFMEKCLTMAIKHYNKEENGGPYNWVYSVHPKTNWTADPSLGAEKIPVNNGQQSGNPAEAYLAIYKSKIAFMGGYISSINKGFDDDKTKFNCFLSKANDLDPSTVFFRKIWSLHTQPNGYRGLIIFNPYMKENRKLIKK